MILAHRRPFGEGHPPSESEAELAGRAFHDILDERFTTTPEAQESADAYLVSRSLDLSIAIEGTPGIIARLYHQTTLGSGDYIERVGLYERGKNEKEWGPKICDYVTGSGDPVARRYDTDDELTKMADEMPVDEGQELDVIVAIFKGLALESAMGLNGAPVGIGEVHGLRDLLATGTPLTSVDPQR